MPGGLKANRSITTRKGGSPFHFLRVLRYSKPYLKFLYPAMGCVVLVAMTYSLNILAIMPVVHLIVEKQGIPAWAHQYVVENRMDIVLEPDQVPGQPAYVAKIRHENPVYKDVHTHDLLKCVDGEALEGVAAIKQLAYLADGQEARLEFVRPATSEAYEVAVIASPISFTDHCARKVAGWLPQGTDKSARLKTLFIVLMCVLGVGVFGAICRFWGEYLIAMVAGRTLVAIRRRMYERVLNLPLSHFATRGISDFMSRFVQDSQDIYRGLNFVFAKSLREPLKALFALAVALVLDWRITIVTVVGAPLGGLLIRNFGKIIRRANKRLLEGYGRMLAALEGSLTGIRVVKGYTMEHYERRHLYAVDQQMLKQQLKIARTEAMASPVFEVLGHIVATVAVLYFANLMFDGQMEPARFAALAAAMAAMFDPVRKMSSFYNRIQQSNAAVDRVFEVIDMADELAESAHKPALPSLQQHIEFRDLRFTYPGSETPALDGVSLVINRGERVAFVGPNGSGKTTLLSMLMRFFEPSGGALLFDGRDVRDFSITSLRKQMSLITQDTVIFADTLANNIAYGDEKLLQRIVLRRRHPERSYDTDGYEESIVAAAKAAYADEFICDKPDGYDTYVGEHGSTLSGGQKQRIAIARAILRNAPIFIFDEATSQIDAESEHKIHDAVTRFLEGRTALIIAHRFSTILQADRIVVMDRGRIVDSGRHEELMNRCGLYKTLYSTQIAEHKDDDEMARGIDGAPPPDEVEMPNAAK